ncbi:hypothetical protein TNCV_342971 [Trichonephila clavipes]|nr:hypothetical protein TNCV_342971 [Trichonephila clavipes]
MAPGSEVSLKLPISNSSLHHCDTNCSSSFCRRRSPMRHSLKTKTEVSPLSSAPLAVQNRVFFRQYHSLTTTPNNYAQWIHSSQVFLQYRGKKIYLLVALLHDLVQTQLLVMFSSSS